MRTVRVGDIILIRLLGKLEDGTLFLTTKNKPSIKFRVGSETLLPGIEKACVGLHLGEKKKVHISPEEGFGPYDDKLIIEVDRALFPPTIVKGQEVELSLPNLSFGVVKVLSIGKDKVLIDANHPWSRQTLEVTIKVDDILSV